MSVMQVAIWLLAAALLAPVGPARAACDCAGAPFKASRSAKLGRGATVLGNVRVNDVRGRLKLASGVFMPATTNLTSHLVIVGSEGSAGSVNANLIRFHPTATVAGPVVGPLALPVETPFCSLAPLTCGGDSVTVNVDQGVVTLEPGTYSSLKIGRGGFARLLPGTYNVCSFTVSHTGALVAEGPVTINVLGSVRAATHSIIVPATGQPRIVLNVEGSKVVFGNNSVVRAEVTAPNARLKIGVLAAFDGCSCSRDVKIGLTATASCTVGSPSGAFLD